MSISVYSDLLKIHNSGKEILPNLIGNIHDLKLRIILETEFMRDTQQQYLYLMTPDNVGRDLRELIFNRADKETRDILLNEINRVKPEKIIPHILTDIDDTLFPNFNGVFETFGSDCSWKNHQVYPGLKKLYSLFYDNIPVEEARYSTVLTGTPAFLKGARIDNTVIKEALGNRFGFIQGFDKKREALYSLVKGMYEQPFYKLAISINDLATIKYERFKQYRQLFPEFRLIFVGDNGQGDLIAGKKIIHEDPQCQVFIHNLLRGDKFIFSEEEIKSKTEPRLHFFKNYLELGYLFLKLGYITRINFKELRDSIADELQESHRKDKDRRHYFHYMKRQTLKNKRV